MTRSARMAAVGAGAAAAGSLLAAGPALAHVGVGATSGVLPGLLHPLMGADHVLAGAAVGLWAAMLAPRPAADGRNTNRANRRRIRALLLPPGLFLAGMMLGAALGWAGIALPMVEAAIALSVIAFGLMVAFRAPRAAGLLIIGGFALFHGHAHAAEAAGSVLAYLAGFVIATAGLHLAGLALGALITRRPVLRRLAGIGTALAGVAILAS